MNVLIHHAMHYIHTPHSPHHPTSSPPLPYPKSPILCGNDVSLVAMYPPTHPTPPCTIVFWWGIETVPQSLFVFNLLSTVGTQTTAALVCPSGSSAAAPDCDCNATGYTGTVNWSGTDWTHTCGCMWVEDGWVAGVHPNGVMRIQFANVPFRNEMCSHPLKKEKEGRKKETAEE